MQLAKKFFAAFCALSLAVTAALPYNGNSLVGVTVAAAASESSTVTYDFRDGSIISGDTDKTKDVTSGNLTAKANTFRYNDATHGVEFKAGSSIEIKVGGSTKVTVGDCQHSAATKLTVKSSDGSYTDTKSVGSACYPNAAEFEYTGSDPTTLILELDDKAYIPIIITEPITKTVVDNEPHTYDFRDGSIISGDTDKTKDVISGNLTAKANTFRYNDATHGVEFKAGSSIEIKVGGSTKVTVGDCQHSAATKLTVKSSDGSYTDTKSVGSACYPNAAEFEYTGSDPTTLILELDDKAYIPIIIIEPIEVSEEPDPSLPPETVGNGKADVWDFGAEQLDTELYNNKLTVDIINGFYPEGTATGSSGVEIGSFETPDGELRFEAGSKVNNRIRTTNKAITRKDEKSMTIGDTVLSGYVYSNSEAVGSAIHIAVKLYENDILIVYAGGNNKDSEIVCESPSGSTQSAVAAKSGQMLTFYAPETGTYKIYSADEKLVVARLIREHTTPVKVSGTVDTSAAEGIANYKLCFTNTSTDKAIEVAPKDGAYTVYLYDSYTYEMSLVDANGYIIKDNAPLKIAKGSGDLTKDIALMKVGLVTVTGKLTGLSEDALAKLKLSFVNKEYAYVPEFTIYGSDITVQLEKDVEYKIVAEGINDYELSGIKTIKAAEDGTQDIAFALKPVYDITVTLTDLPESAKSSAGLTFTNLNEEGYTYKFAAGETPKLRDGTYSVKVTGTGSAAYVQKVTSNLNVDGAAVSKTIGFEPIEEWDFTKYYGNPGIETIGGKTYYLGLELTGNVKENGNKYLLVGTDAEVKIPVKKGMIITLEYCYEAAFKVADKQVANKSGSTSKLETTQVAVSEDGFLTITGIKDTDANASQTYFTKISVKTATEYKAKLTVGADKDYKTINDALAAAAQMSRPNNERVEIVIDPGNYEEMLVINIPNVSLINAAGKSSSLEIINKGVDIGENVVRITSYYGHGYNYYSMGSDCKWNAEVLAANKANGYISTKNPGSGTTNGSYWNSTVVVTGDGFEADGIVFENSFNQYISKKEAADTVVMWETGSKGQRPTTVGDTSVQQRKFVERAAAVSIVGDKSVFNNCKFIGRQDTLYGGQNIKAVFQKCDILGAVDYIFGGMTAVFYQCNLVMNTDADKNDQAYLTAAQQASGRGYLMYNCTVTSTTPEVDTASETRSKPGYFGRPWQANTSEVVFYNTIIETSDYPGSEGKSLIEPDGWKDSLSGQSAKMYEYGTTEKSKEDNSASRAEWATLLDTPYIDGGETEITIKAFLGDWTDELNERDLVLELSKTPETPETPDDPEDPESPEEPAEFEDNDIEVTVPADAFDDADEITFNADPVDDETDNNQFTFDLSFTDKDGNKVQPNVAVTVKIPVPTALKGKTIYVYHVEDNGTYTQIDCKVENGMVVFTASKFSKYIVTSEKLTASGETPSTPGTSDESTSSTPSEGTSSAPGGDTSSVSGESEPSNSNPSTGVGAGMTFAFAALAGGIVIVTKKKR